jgi:uncharacterized protein YcnI
MKRTKLKAFLLSCVAGLLASGGASAHISISSGPGFATKTQIVTFGVGHGCEGSDTRKVRVQIPDSVVSVRALNSDLGAAKVETNATGAVTAVVWEKLASELLDADTNYYTVSLRIRIPDAPFTTLYFRTYQTCGTGAEELEVAWAEEVPEDQVPEGKEPAPALQILPARVPGWNKFQVPRDISDLSAYFSDALIVWKGEAAYSANPLTAEAIASTEGVSELIELEANDEVWVKY